MFPALSRSQARIPLSYEDYPLARFSRLWHQSIWVLLFVFTVPFGGIITTENPLYSRSSIELAPLSGGYKSRTLPWNHSLSATPHPFPRSSFVPFMWIGNSVRFGLVIDLVLGHFSAALRIPLSCLDYGFEGEEARQINGMSRPNNAPIPVRTTSECTPISRSI